MAAAYRWIMRLLRSGFTILVFSAIAWGATAAQDDVPLDLRSIPIGEWLDAESAEVPWRVTIRRPALRMDQRLEVLYTVGINGRDLNRTGNEHELFLINRVSSADLEWLNEPSIVRHAIDKELPNNVQAQFRMRFAVQPGDYFLWLVLYDRKTGKHNVAKRRLRVPELRNDPLPLAYHRMPVVEFPRISQIEGTFGYTSAELFLPVENKRPLDVHLISTLSPPEQWAGRGRMIRSHNENTIGALSALSQLDLYEGSISISGLDLSRQEVLFEQNDFRRVNWKGLMEAMEKANSLEISADALEGRKYNGAFFRDFLSRKLGPEPSSDPEDPFRVVIVVSSSMLFARGSDLTPLQLEGDCNCRVYHLRFRLNNNDVFDQIARFMRPLRPKTFNLMTPLDLRKAIAEILEELRKL
jgi:hypothetical protein